ncbi:hypothetical protein CHRY9390_01587 [Chryseobacterium aquaeductus]|uniref:Histidine kinase/HSP90-like ATPase domain-containing protein n=1 Tax=Chryseobacterium aquaeductus TaxID=2675056 RepID=A0A9N8MNG3_9FLAO|nr:ATP-binding protein [Chryseobacterium aquaeductus]CAA7330908.1 hypothetical protein CHRY9390_01587 [Chryseobacterium potabilaquae]CAD7806934.1 hypothetical protein CHRY9390_01587 [Chryseobacterium aquaeductus]
MSIFSLQDMNAIMEYEHQLHDHSGKVSHIQNCYAKVLNRRLFQYFGTDYLFHTAYYLEEGRKFHQIEFTDLPNQEETIRIKNYIHSGAQLIFFGKQQDTFTELMCKAHKQVFCLFKRSKVNLFHRDLALGETYFQQDILSKTAISSISRFFNEHTLNIQPLIDTYRLVAGTVPNCYIYFIRPFTHFKNYNGVFSIILKKQLNEAELTELGLIWTKILSDTVIIEVKIEAKNIEQNSIFDEHTHTWNNEITSISQHLDVINKRFITDIEKMDTHSIRYHIDFAVHKTDILRKIVSFNLFLMKTQGYADWDEVDRQNFSDSHDLLIKSNRMAVIPIQDVLKKALDTVALIFESHKETISHYQKKEIAINTLYKNIDKIENVLIEAIPIGVYIIFLDLLKNAVEHMDKDGGVRIELHSESTHYFLDIVNDGEMPKDMIEYIKTGQSNQNFKRKGGIRMIKRIIDCALFSTQKWGLDTRKNLSKKLTAICLTIPKMKE